MNFDEILEERYSVRDFSEEKVTRDEILKAVSLASFSPSAKNHQPYKVMVIENEEVLDKLKETVPLFNSKTVLLFYFDEKEAWHNKREDGKTSGEIDTTIFATTLMYVLWEMEIGSCMVKAFSSREVADLLNLKENEVPVLFLPIGYLSEKSKPLSGFHDKRRQPSELIEWKL